MAADGTPGAKGNPQFLGTGAPATAADMNLVSTWAADNIDRSVATVAALPSTGNFYGRAFRVVADNSYWAWLGAGWVRLGEDSLWSTITLTNGAAVADGQTPRRRRLNKVVHLSGRFTAATLASFTLAADDRPEYPCRFVVATGNSGTGVAHLVVNTDGNVFGTPAASINLAGVSWSTVV